MHPMFAELFMRPDEEPDADDRRRVRRARRPRQLRTISAARGTSGGARRAPAGRRAG
jgi:hypothetical protein